MINPVLGHPVAKCGRSNQSKKESRSTLNLCIPATTCLRMLLGIRHGGAADDEGGVGPIHLGAHAAEAPQDERRVTAEDATVSVRLVDHHVSAGATHSLSAGLSILVR